MDTQALVLSYRACTLYSPNSITPTLRQSPEQVPDKVTDLLRTQIMNVRNTNHVADFHDLCPQQVRDFVGNLFRTLTRTFPVHCNGQNSIRATQTGLSRTCHELCRKHLDMSRWFVSATFVICVGDFPHGEVSVKVNVMEFGPIHAQSRCLLYTKNLCAISQPFASQSHSYNYHTFIPVMAHIVCKQARCFYCIALRLVLHEKLYTPFIPFDLLRMTQLILN